MKPVFDKAMECGLNLWDTTAIYGEGSFIKDVNHEDIIISTKFTLQIAGCSPKAIQEMLDGSKMHLYADVMDIYWIHNPMDIEKWTPKLIPLTKIGQIKTIGVSNHNLSEIKWVNEILVTENLKISTVQNHFSLLHRSSERTGILNYCKENGIVFFAYIVQEQGTLTGRYIAKRTFPIIDVTKVTQVEEAAQAAQITLTAEEICRLEKLGDETGVHTLWEWEKEMV